MASKPDTTQRYICKATCPDGRKYPVYKTQSERYYIIIDGIKKSGTLKEMHNEYLFIFDTNPEIDHGT